MCMYVYIESHQPQQLKATCITGTQAARLKNIQLCVWLERQTDAGWMAGGQAGTQKVREAMDGRETDGQADRQVDRQEGSAGQ